jgi:hypothetical protein
LYKITALFVHNTSAKRLLVACPLGQATQLDVLIQAYQLSGIYADLVCYEGKPNIAAIVHDIHSDYDAILLVGAARWAPHTVLDGPFIRIQDRVIPIGWLPLTDADALWQFAQTVKKVHNRPSVTTGLALLGQWHPRYLHLVGRVEQLMFEKMPTFRWTSDVIPRDEVVKALGSGLGLGIYFGHGRPIGWCGYYGMRTNHFEAFEGEPLGCMLSLCCHTASRKRTGLSYAEALPLMGVSAAAFGATRATLHTDNTRWAVRICETLQRGEALTIGDLIVQSAPPADTATKYYRIIGDPLAPIHCSKQAVLRAQAVQTYA